MPAPDDRADRAAGRVAQVWPGNSLSRQREYAAYDMKLHTGVPPAPMPAWAEIEGKSRAWAC